MIPEHEPEHRQSGGAAVNPNPRYRFWKGSERVTSIRTSKDSGILWQNTGTGPEVSIWEN